VHVSAPVFCDHFFSFLLLFTTSLCPGRCRSLSLCVLFESCSRRLSMIDLHQHQGQSCHRTHTHSVMVGMLDVFYSGTSTLRVFVIVKAQTSSCTHHTAEPRPLDCVGRVVNIRSWSRSPRFSLPGIIPGIPFWASTREIEGSVHPQHRRKTFDMEGNTL
jgi:hypothetical protein